MTTAHTSNNTPPRRFNAWSIMQPVRGQIRLALGLSTLSALSGLMAVALFAFTIHALMQQPQQLPWLPLTAVLLCTVLSYWARLGAFNHSHYAAFRLERILRMQLSERLANAPLGYVQEQGGGALTKVIHDDVKALHVFVADSSPLYARAYATPVATLLILLWLDWRLALATLAVLLCGFGILNLALRKRIGMVKRYNDAREQVSAAIVEFVQAMPVVRTFDSGQMTFSRYQNALNGYLSVLKQWYLEAGFAARFSMAMLGPMPTLAVVLWLGCWLIWRDSLEPVRWLAVLLLCTGMAEAMMPAMMLRHMIEKVKLSIIRIQDVLAAPQLAMPTAEAGRQPQDASVCFEQVTFSYAPDEPPALSDISFYAAPGTVTALGGLRVNVPIAIPSRDTTTLKAIIARYAAPMSSFDNLPIAPRESKIASPAVLPTKTMNAVRPADKIESTIAFATKTRVRRGFAANVSRIVPCEYS